VTLGQELFGFFDELLCMIRIGSVRGLCMLGGTGGQQLCSV
jgi:hypothetical protein